MKKYGCIGKKLTHSFSRDIHNKLADYEYDLIELTEVFCFSGVSATPSMRPST